MKNIHNHLRTIGVLLAALVLFVVITGFFWCLFNTDSVMGTFAITALVLATAVYVYAMAFQCVKK